VVHCCEPGATGRSVLLVKKFRVNKQGKRYEPSDYKLQLLLMKKRKATFVSQLHQRQKMSKIKGKLKEIVNNENVAVNLNQNRNEESQLLPSEDITVYRKNTDDENEPIKSKKKKKNKNQKAKDTVPIDITFANSKKSGGKKEISVSTWVI
jgi:hypothetical protein